MSDQTTKHKPVFIARDGMEKTILPEGTDSVSLVLPNGKEIEITWRHSEQTASLSCDGHSSLHLQSEHVCRLEVER